MLPERSQLKFYFPNPSEGQNYFVVTLPFFENPTIKETKKARFKKYSLISRSSNLYSYQGADSRKLSLTFFMTLPHIIDSGRDLKTGYSDVELGNPDVEKEKFKSPVASPPSTQNSTFQIAKHLFQDLPGLKDSAEQVLAATNWGNIATNQEIDYIQSTYGLNPGATGEDVKAALNAGFPGSQGSQIFTNITDAIAQQANDQQARWSDGQIEKLKVIDTLIYWVNIVRSSVLNNSQNPIYGPPIIRLRHGVMYQDIPCLCTGYTISVEEKAGHDLQTLMPRRLKISMNLEENRTGDFGKFEQNNPVKKDNLAGWESVLTGPQTTDPGYTF